MTKVTVPFYKYTSLYQQYAKEVLAKEFSKADIRLPNSEMKSFFRYQSWRWCLDQTDDGYNSIEFIFDNEEDAMWFKLKWL